MVTPIKFLKMHIYTDQYEGMYRAISVSTVKGKRCATFKKPYLPNDLIFKTCDIKLDPRSNTEYVKLSNGAILWADEREQY